MMQRAPMAKLGCVPLILPRIYRDTSRSPLLVDVIIHKKTIVALGAADDNIRSEHWYELAAAIAGLVEIPISLSYFKYLDPV